MSSTEILDTLENEAQEDNKQSIERTTTSNKAVSIKHTMMKKSFYRLAIILILAILLLICFMLTHSQIYICTFLL